ncbi:MAG: leucyl aminopeptidase [Candidatus Omnitrophica bacterium]|nr:leucyl aminopeptidase [Candidatus Omnitrophota bacterium]
MTQFKLATGSLTSRQGPILLGITEGKNLPSWAGGWSESVRKAVQRLLGSGQFKGKLNETFLLPEGSRWLILVGAGKKEELTLDRVRQAAASASRRAMNAGIESFSRGLVQVAQATAEEVAQAVTEGTLLGTYRYDELKNVPAEERRRLKSVTMVVPAAKDLSAARRGVARGRVIAEAVCWGRDLINRPANRLTPRIMAAEAKGAARRFRFSCRVLDPARMRRLGMNAVLAVAQGSVEPAQFIILEYRGRGSRSGGPLLFAGKGITFDSGGISIKPAAKMEQMKYDMSGGAAVLASIRAIAALKLPVHVVGLVPATENLPSGSAQRPGDVIRTYSGKTVEVENTDAEGRLVLADALGYAQRFKPRAILDLATLTGACVVALGHHAMAVMGNDERLIERVQRSASRTHERVWRLPLWPEYGEQIRSDVADLKNVGVGGGGTITAGYFLKEFAGKTPWVHLDIAGVAWAESDQPYRPKGATGAGVRLLVDLASHWREER